MEKVLRRIPLLQLAYLGDSIYESHVRYWAIENISGSMNEMHKKVVQYVKASAQAQIVHKLQEEFTDVEKDVIRRGRNAKSSSTPKHAHIQDYRLATGFEVLIGALYLSGDLERIGHIVQKGIEVINEETFSKR